MRQTEVDPVELLAQRKGDKPLRWLKDQIGDVSIPYLSYVLRRERPPGPKILKFLGIKQITPPPFYIEETPKSRKRK